MINPKAARPVPADTGDGPQGDREPPTHIEPAAPCKHPRDRAAVLAVAVTHIITRDLLRWLDDRDVSLAATRAEIEDLMRDEILDAVRQAINETRLRDE